MNQSLRNLLEKLDVTPEDLCELSDTVNESLRLRVGSISTKDPHALGFHLDEIDAAVGEVSKMKVDAAYMMSRAQGQMREIQREYVTRDDLKVTQAERLYKIDSEHRELEECLVKLNAIISYCETCEGILRNKYFEIKRKQKD